MFLKKIDFVYWILRFLMYSRVFRQLKVQLDHYQSEHDRADDDDGRQKFAQLVENVRITFKDVTTNTVKQSLSFYASLIICVFAHHGIRELWLSGKDTSVPLLILTPILSGFIVSWYVITFASIRKEFLFEGFIITFGLFAVFQASLGIMAIIAWYFLPWGLSTAISIIIFCAVVASFKYDMVDLLRVGIDEEGLKFYVRANAQMEKGMQIFTATS